MDLITRAQWGAPAASPAADLTSARGVAVHWAGASYAPRAHSGCAAAVRSIRAAHLAHPTEGYVDVAYNLLVCEHGAVYEGRGARKRSGANGSATANQTHYAVCALWAKDSGPAPDELKSGLRDAIDYLRARGAEDAITGHRDHVATECPGDELYVWARAGAPRPTTTTTPETGDDTMPTHTMLGTSSDRVQTVERGDWTTLVWDREYGARGWVDRPAQQTIIKGPAIYSVSVGVRFQGLPPGTEVQMRVGTNYQDGGAWRGGSRTPINSPVHVGGGGHFTYSWTSQLGGDWDERLVAEVLVPGTGAPCRIDWGRVEVLHWPA